MRTRPPMFYFALERSSTARRDIALRVSHHDAPHGGLNEVNNITTSRAAALGTHPSSTIYVLLFGPGLCSALVAGYGMAAGSRLSGMHAIVFAAVMGFCVFVIRDMEYPRLGFIRVTQTDRVMTDLRDSMH